MNIFGSTRYATYGADKVSFDTLKDVVKATLGQWKEHFQRDLKIIEALQAKPLSFIEEEQAVHTLFERAVDNNMRKKKDWVLNISQCVKFKEELIKKRNTNEALTWWDLTQAGTEHMKPYSQDMISLYPTVQSFNAWVADRCEIVY